MAARPKVCIDRFCRAISCAMQRTTRARGRDRAIAPIGKTWMNGSTLQVRFLGGTTAQKNTVREQAGWWTQHANLKFDFNDAPTPRSGSASIPTTGPGAMWAPTAGAFPLNEATMNLGFMDGGTTAHEFGHAIGLAHEHQNPAGGIQWNEEVVIRELAKSPNFWDEATARHNVLRKYTADQINGTQFDPDSIMLYFFPADWTLNGIGTKANEVLSDLDKQFAAGAKMYPKTGPTVDAPVELNVNASKRTAASIGKFGEEDLFAFKVTKPGRHVIDTRGPTDIVMKLFGPDSPTALIAEDDDSGVEYNARISADLIQGRYFVQVRHFNRSTGMGNYTVRVSRP